MLLLPRNNSTFSSTLRLPTNSTHSDGDLEPTISETITKITLELKPILKEMDIPSLREYMPEEETSSMDWLEQLPWIISDSKDLILF